MRLLLNDSDSSADISLIYLPFLDYKDVEVLLEVESSNKGVCSLSEFSSLKFYLLYQRTYAPILLSVER